MDTNPSHTSSDPPYTPLPDNPSPARIRRPFNGFAAILASLIFLLSLVALIINQSQESLPEQNQNRSPSTPRPTESFSKPEPRGVAQGVSPKSNPSFFSDKVSYNWTNAMFSWQRTAYHFQPEKNWMNGRCNINSSLHFSFLAINGR